MYTAATTFGNIMIDCGGRARQRVRTSVPRASSSAATDAGIFHLGVPLHENSILETPGERYTLQTIKLSHRQGNQIKKLEDSMSRLLFVFPGVIAVVIPLKRTISRTKAESWPQR